MIKVSPSILAADFFNLEKDVRKLEAAGVDMLHIDVMDGLFVPNMSFGMPIISALKKNTDIPLDVHLMIDRPHRYFKEFVADADFLGFHFEAGSDCEKLLKDIKDAGKKSCITIKPATEPEEISGLLPYCDMVLVMSVEPGFGGQKFMPSSLEKIKTLKEMAKIHGYNYDVEVDGGINFETAKLAVDAGVDVLVMGSFLFADDNIAEKVKIIKNYK